jgi:PAS domain S-box-containing protein
MKHRALALLLPLTTFGLQWLLWPLIQPLAWLLFCPAVLASAWIGGLAAGLTTTLVSAILVWWFFLDPPYTLLRHESHALISTAIFIVTGVAFSLFHDRLKRSQRRYETLFEQAPDGVFLADIDGRYTDVNPAACNMLGYTRDELLSMRVTDLVLATDHDRLQATHNMQRHGGVEMSCWQLRCKDGRIIDTEICAKILPGGIWQAYVRDITQQKLAEAALKRNKFELGEAQRLGRIGSWIWDVDADKLNWSPELYRIFGIDTQQDAPTYQDLANYYTPDSWTLHRDTVAQALAAGTAYEIELQFMRHDGTTGWLIATGEAVRDANGIVITLRGTAQDITDRKNLQAELLASHQRLRDMVVHHEVACEEERKHLAREIHDEMGQLLTGLHMDVALVKAHRHSTQMLQDTLDDMNALIARTFAMTRNVVTSLRPAVLDLGLISALEWLMADFQNRGQFHCTFDTNVAQVPIRDSQVAAMFRIAQETLTNVARHARATQVKMTLRYHPHELQLYMQDNGIGFNKQAHAYKEGYGLLQMRERVLSLGGQLEIKTAIGCGTTVMARVPTQPVADITQETLTADTPSPE